MTQGFESIPDPLSREDEDRALIGALMDGNPLAPWRTNWNDRSLSSWISNSDEIPEEFTAEWQISEYMAMRAWFTLRTPDLPHHVEAAREYMKTAIDQFKDHFTDELAEASVCHALDNTPSYLSLSDLSVDALYREGSAVSHDARGLWPVERKLAKMLDFWITTAPDYTPEMGTLPVSKFV